MTIDYYNNLKIINSNNIKLIQDVPNSSYYITLHDIKVYINNYYFIIPKGFKTDGASIPKYVQSLYYKPLDDAVLIAGLVHDFLFLQHTSDHNYDKNEYSFNKEKKIVKIQLYNNDVKVKKLILSNTNATYLYNFLVKKYARNEYVGFGLCRINLKPKKLLAGKVVLNLFTAYKWINNRSTYMFKNINKISNELNLENYVPIIMIEDKYFDKCISDNIILNNSKKYCSIM